MASGTEIFRLFGTILIDSSQAEASLGKTDDSAKNVQNSFAGAVAKGQILGNALTKVASAMLDVATNVVKTGIAYNAEIEKYTTGFTNMLGSAQAAQEVMAAIQEDASRTPFDVASLTQANQLLISAGENAGYSRKVIMALGDAVSATGGGNAELSRMAANLQQIANVGKATAVDIKQFANAGINIYQVLADYTGKSVQEVQSLTVSYDLLSEALIAASEEGGRYYNAMDTQSQTLNGRVSTLKDNVNQLAGLLTENLTEAVGKVVEKLNEMVVAAQEAYRTDGWEGLILKLTGLEKIGNRVGATFAGIAAQVKAMASGDLSEWKAFFDPTGQSGTAYKKAYNEYLGNKNAGTKNDNYWKQYGDRMAKQYGLETADATSSIATSPTTDTKKAGTSKTTSAAKKTAQVIDSLTEKTQQVANGITTAIQQVTEKHDDGTEHITKTVTESGTEIVDGVARNYKTITKYVDGVQQKVEKTVEAIDTSVSAVQTKIDQQLSEAKTKWQNGIMGTLQSVLTDLKNGNWTSLATDFAKLIWGEVTQEQRDIISKWFLDALTAINDSYSGGGLSGLKDTLHKLLTDGITSDANDAKVAVQGLSQVINGLGESGGMGAKLAGIAGNFSSMAGGITKALGSIVGFIISNPVVAVILGLTALVGGAAVASWSKNKSEKVTNNYESPFDKTPVYDSLAEFSARADQLNRYSSITTSPFAGSQQDTTGKQQLSVLQRISNSLDEHLPAIGTGTLVIDANGVQALAGAMQPTLTNGIDGDLGIRAARKARGG